MKIKTISSTELDVLETLEHNFKFLYCNPMLNMTPPLPERLLKISKIAEFWTSLDNTVLKLISGILTSLYTFLTSRKTFLKDLHQS